MSETLIPAEVMAKAAFELDWTSWEDFKAANPDTAAEWINKMRAALRALAAMTPTERIKRAFWDVNDMAFFGDICAKTWSGTLEAAASEGEVKKP
jgi:hypothetical protein